MILTPFYFRVFGMTFRSDIALPGLDPVPGIPPFDHGLILSADVDRFDFDDRAEASPSYVSSMRIGCDRPALQVWELDGEPSYLFQFYDGVQFLIRRDNGDIHVVWPKGSSLQAATHHLLFSLPGFLLGLRGAACLQGAAFEAPSGAIVLLGESKSGKSVLSAAIASRGHRVFSDDLIAVQLNDGAAKVHSGYPWISLRPGSLSLLGSFDIALDRVGPEWDYLDETYASMDLRGMRSNAEPRPIEAILVLSPEEGAHFRPTIEPLTQLEAMIALMKAAESTRIPRGGFRKQEFSLSGAIAASAPAFRLRYNLSSETLTDLTDVLLQSDPTRT